MMKSLIIFVITLTLVFDISAQRGAGNVKIQNENGQTQEIRLYEASYALIIGASSYNNGWQKLSGVKDDITAVNKILTRHGFTVETVTDPTSDNLLSIINRFVNQHGFVENNRLLIYFAGHGYTETGGDGRKFGYIVPVDAPDPTKNRIGFQQKAVTMDEIETVARRIRSKHALFVFDSCFSGSLVSRSKTFVPPVINYLAAQSVRQFITAGSDNQEVPDESVFRQMFVRGLEGEADANKDGYITGTELAVYLQEKVIYYRGEMQTPQYGKIRDPKLDRGDFIFTIASQKEIQNTSETDAKNAGFYFESGVSHYNKGEYDAAIRDFTKAIELDPKDAAAYDNRGTVYDQRGDYDAAIRDTTKAIEVNPKYAKAYFDRGISYKNKGDYNAAILDYTKAIEINPKYATAYNSRGTAYARQGDYDSAMRDFTKTIELDSKYVAAYNNRGTIYAHNGDYNATIRDFTKVIELEPQYATAYYNRGTAYAHKSDYDAAIRDFTKAIELEPKDAAAYGNRGNSYDQKGDYNAAIRDYTKAIELKPKDASTYFNRGISYKKKGDYDAAIRDYNKAIELDPKDADFYYNRASAYDKIGQNEKAEADRRKYKELGGK